jgi:hypothetical protein
MLKIGFCFTLIVLTAWMQQESLGGEPPEDKPTAASQTVKMIAEAIASAKDQPDQARLRALQALATAVQEKHPHNVFIADQLKAATTLESYEAALRSVVSILSFKPKEEADLPKGFPSPTPLGEIQLKQYPAYRLARTPSKNDSGFFKLFAHITMNRIEMTAPVEMTYQANDKNKPEQIDMAFIYGDSNLGKTGNKFGGVTVSDIPAITTVTIGLKGDNDRANLVEVEQRLENWLKQNATDYERAGNLRVLGYNSPQVRNDLRFYEVELPIQKKQ